MASRASAREAPSRRRRRSPMRWLTPSPTFGQISTKRHCRRAGSPRRSKKRCAPRGPKREGRQIQVGRCRSLGQKTEIRPETENYANGLSRKRLNRDAALAVRQDELEERIAMPTG